MLRQSSVFALALISGAASAQTLTSTVNTLLGTGGATAAPLTAPVGAAISGPVSMLDSAVQPVTGNAPLPGLTQPKSSGGTLALGVLDGNDTGNGGTISAAVLSGTNSGNSGNPSGNTLSVGVLNQGDPLHIYGMGMGIGPFPGMQANPLPAALTGPLLGVSNTLYTTLRMLTALGEPLSDLSALEAVTNGNALPTEAALFGGPTRDGTRPADMIVAGVLTGNNSGNGGQVGAAVLTTGSSTESRSAQGSTAGVGVLNGNAAGGGGGGGGPNVDPGANPDDNDESAQNTGDSELCALLAKDNRGQVKGKLREKAHCAKLKTPKA